LCGEPAVQLVLVPVRDDGADPVVRRDRQHPGLVQIELFLLVGHRKKVIGLGAVDGDLGHGGVVGGHEQPPHADHQVGEGPGQLAQVRRAVSGHRAVPVKRDQGHRGIRRHHAQDLVDLPGFDVAEELLRQLTRAQRFTPPAASAGRRRRLRLIPGSAR
jgi:hypothetical protein